MQQAREASDTGLRQFPGHGRSRDAELARLRKENRPLWQANEILKKAAVIFAPPVTVYRFIKANLNRYTVTEMAAILGVSRSAYYRWCRHGVFRQRWAADAEIVRLIREIASRHRHRYGSPRVRLELGRVHGLRVSLKRVARLMRENSLNARRRRRFVPTTDSTHDLKVCENILNREFHAAKGELKLVHLSADPWRLGIPYRGCTTGRFGDGR